METKRVPVEPTEEMLSVDAPPVADRPDQPAVWGYRRGIWKAMLAAAPSEPEHLTRMVSINGIEYSAQNEVADEIERLRARTAATQESRGNEDAVRAAGPSPAPAAATLRLIECLCGPRTHICWTPDAVPEEKQEQVVLVRNLDLLKLEDLARDGLKYREAIARGPVAYGVRNTAITGRPLRMMSVRLEVPSDDQYGGQLWTPLYALEAK